MLLEGDSGKKAVFFFKFLGIFRLHRHDHAAIGKGRVPLREAHAIDDDFVIFGRRRDDESSGAHAKGVNSRSRTFVST